MTPREKRSRWLPLETAGTHDAVPYSSRSASTPRPQPDWRSPPLMRESGRARPDASGLPRRLLGCGLARGAVARPQWVQEIAEPFDLLHEAVHLFRGVRIGR